MIHSKIINPLSDPQKAAWVLVGMAIALVFALGFDIIQYSNNKDLKSDVRGLNLRIINQNEVTAQAAYKACTINKPRVTALFMGLEKFYRDSYNTTNSVLRTTQKGSALYKARLSSLHNDTTIVRTLRSYLPIKCTVPKAKS